MNDPENVAGKDSGSLANEAIRSFDKFLADRGVVSALSGYNGPRCRYCGWPIRLETGLWEHHLGQEIGPRGMPTCRRAEPRKNVEDGENA